jgi:multidrug efflux pump subunit AcrB
MTFRHKTDLIGIFAKHPVAANLLMLMMILAGIWGLSRLNTQFFPNFELDLITVRTVWTGASAEDIETSITIPLEQELRMVDGLRKLTSTSSEGISAVSLEYEEGTDMGVALDRVKERVALIRNLPTDAEEPEISRVIRYEPIARVLVTGTRSDLRELRPLVRDMERDLLGRGIASIEISGLPEEEIAIQVSSTALHELGMSLGDVAQRVAETSRDLPAGTVGRSDVGRQLRSLDQRRDALGFERLPLAADEDGRLLQVADVAEVERRSRPSQVHLRYAGRPAVELLLRRAESGDSLEAARILEQWLAERAPALPPGVELHVFDESWQLIEQRTFLLIKNGTGGLILVVAILFLFLNGRVAFWVAVGIPVSFMATLAILYLGGGSINMISLFALIMALGIIVDDAIVVGEDALAHYEAGEDALEAAEGGARRMLVPVSASSLTTIAAFLPLMLVGGVIGNVLFELPLVVVCVILASLFESFLVLPGHIRKSFLHIHTTEVRPLRHRLDEGFQRFRDHYFRPLVKRCVRYGATVLMSAIALLVLAAGLVVGGRVSFTFFPTPESDMIYANVVFGAGTPPRRIEELMGHLEETLRETDEALGGGLVVTPVTRIGESVFAGGRASVGEQLGSMMVQLVEPDQRTVRNSDFIRAWRERVVVPPGIENFSIYSRRGGPPGRDVEIRLVGNEAHALKAAAIELAESLKSYPGTGAVQDDMPFGQEQLVYRLTPMADALGLTVESVGRQLRAAYDGRLAQIFQDGPEEVEVRVVLPDAERYSLASLESLPIVIPSGETVPLLNVVRLDPQRGFETLRHAQGKLAVEVSADVDTNVNNSDAILASLESGLLPQLSTRYGIDYSFEGRAADQRETLGDMRKGVLFALLMIYLVLAWVFGSYGWPLVVMAVIPFGLIGAVSGHWLMGIDLTILSLFGLFGLSGIVVNDSIILVSFYKRLREEGMPVESAIVEAACQRLRAVLLTSLTTIAGLTPLLFETSLQAQFLIPMAVSISFGLAVTTLLVLIVVPTLLAGYERLFGRPPAARRLPATALRQIDS